MPDLARWLKPDGVHSAMLVDVVPSHGSVVGMGARAEANIEAPAAWNTPADRPATVQHTATKCLVTVLEVLAPSLIAVWYQARRCRVNSRRLWRCTFPGVVTCGHVAPTLPFSFVRTMDDSHGSGGGRALVPRESSRVGVQYDSTK